MLDTLTEFNFDEVLKSEIPIVIDFWAAWCKPCRLLYPVLLELEEEYKGKLIFGKVDVDTDSIIAREYQIKSLPTLIIFKEGKPIKTLIGVLPKKRLIEELDMII